HAVDERREVAQQVAITDDAGDPAILDHDQVMEAVLVEQGAHIVDALVGLDRHEFSGHGLSDTHGRAPSTGAHRLAGRRNAAGRGGRQPRRCVCNTCRTLGSRSFQRAPRRLLTVTKSLTYITFTTPGRANSAAASGSDAAASASGKLR